MSLDQFAVQLADGLSDSLVTLVGKNLGLDDAYEFKTGESLNVSSMDRPIVQASDDLDEDYDDEMAQLQKKLERIRKQKQAEKKKKQQEIERMKQKAKQQEEIEKQRRQKEITLDALRRQAQEESQKYRNGNQIKKKSFFDRRYDEIQDDIDHPEDILSNLGKDIEEAEEDVVQTAADLDRFYRSLRRMGILLWVFNLGFVSLPFTVVTIVNFGANILLNIIMNQWWAYGNLFLIGNTLYMLTQTMIALPLIYEIPFILQWIKPFRFVALLSGILYNVMYWFSAFDMLFIFFVETPKEERIKSEPVAVDHVLEPLGKEVIGEDVPVDAEIQESDLQIMDVLFVLGTLYMLVTHFPVTMINGVIMIKESMLYFWPLLTQAALHSQYPIESKLTLIDLQMFSPLYWFSLVWNFEFGYDPKDWIVENQDDEDHYYAGQIFNVVKSKFS